MQSVKAQSHGKGPYSYSQRVLMDGARPFSHQALIHSLLGQPQQFTAQPLNASRVQQQTDFLYPFYAAGNDISNADVSNSGQPTVLQSADSRMKQHALALGEPSYPRQPQASEDLSDNTGLPGKHRPNLSHGVTKATQVTADPTGAGQTALDQQPRGGTLLSWLEQAQARVPQLFVDSHRTEVSPTGDAQLPQQLRQKNRGAQADRLQALIASQAPLEPINTSSGEGEVVDSDHVSPMNTTRDLNRDLKQNTQQHPDRPDKPGRQGPVKMSSTDIHMPSPVPGESRRHEEKSGHEKTTVTGDAKRPAVSTNLSTSAPPSPGSPASAAAMPTALHLQQTIDRVRPITSAFAATLAAARYPHGAQSQAVFKPAPGVPAMNLDKLRQAVHTQQVVSRQVPPPQQDTPPMDAAPVPPATPQVQQKVVVLRSPTPGTGGRQAFLERAYLGRLGPRGYK